MPPLRTLLVWLAISMAPETALGAQGQVPKLSEVRAVVLRSGVNVIPAMTDDRRSGMIVTGYKNYFTADGAQNIFLVMTRNSRERHPQDWSVVTTGKAPNIEPDDPVTQGDGPHTGDDVVRSVRFARADLDGRRAFVMLIAQRAFEGSIPSPSHVTISIYRLDRDRDLDADVFVYKGEIKPSACFGNADLALNKVLGLALPPFYSGPSSSGACGSSD
jgi:hypothetical protein